MFNEDIFDKTKKIKNQRVNNAQELFKKRSLIGMDKLMTF